MPYKKQKKWSPRLSLNSRTKQSSELSQLTLYAQKLSSLEVLLEQALPTPLKQCFKVNTLKSGQLTLTCSKATQKALFRANQADILKHLNQLKNSIAPISSVLIKVKPVIRSKKQIRERIELSQENADILHQEAMNTEDDKLREILLKLSKRASTKTND